MNYLVLVLRLVHIVAGVFWVGGSLITTVFLLPASAAAGQAGQAFLAQLVRTTRFVQRFAAAAGITVLAGAALYWIDSAGLRSEWMRSAPGWGFGIGAVFALLGFVVGIRVGRVTRRVAELVSAIKGEPTQGQVLELDSAQRQMARLRHVQDGLLVVALALMATARYW